MTLEQIQNFIALADYRNFTKAAERNFISQSSLSRSVASLESSLGVKLLERNTRYVTLTEAGEYLRDEGSRILDELYLLEIRLKDMSEGKIGHLSALVSDFIYTPFSDLCHQFTEQYPRVDIELETDKSWVVPDRIDMREADIGLTFANELGNADLGFHKLASSPICVLVPPFHPLAERDSISIRELDDSEMLYFGDTAMKNSGNSAITGSELGEGKKQRFHIVRSLSTALQRMYAGQGWVILPEAIGRLQADTGLCRLLKLEDYPICADIVLVWRKDNPNPALKAFLDILPQE